MKTRQRIRKIYSVLFSHYGPQHWWPAETPFEVVVGAILTQNTNWSNVEKAIAALKHARALSPRKLGSLSQAQCASLIKSAGFFNQKAQRLKQFVTFLDEKYQGDLAQLFSMPVDTLRTTLLALNGIGPETADSIILYAAHKPVFVIDAYTLRLLERVGIPAHTYHEAQQVFEQALPREVTLYQEYHALMVALAKTHCRKKPVCAACPLKKKKLCQTFIPLRET